MTPKPPNSDKPSPDAESDDIAEAADHDVPNEEVIEKTLPEPPRDRPSPE